MGFTSIPVKESTRDRLAELSRGKETWDEIVNRVIDEAVDKS